MQEITDQVFLSFDGIKFLNKEKCLKHEQRARSSGFIKRAVGLTEEQVDAAIAREDIELADALEKIGAIIAKTRRAAGAMRRPGKRAAGTPATRPASVQAAEPAAEPEAEPLQGDVDGARLIDDRIEKMLGEDAKAA